MLDRLKLFILSLYHSILDLRSNVSYEATVQNVTFYLRTFSYTSVLPFRNESTFMHLVPQLKRCQKYWDKFTYMFIKVVKSLVFGPIFLACNDYSKHVTLHTFRGHLQFVAVAFQIML
jgi:hypothetical protein